MPYGEGHIHSEPNTYCPLVFLYLVSKDDQFDA